MVKDTRPNAHVGMPLRGSTCHFVAALAQLLYPAERIRVVPTFAQASLLPLSFNLLWTKALEAAEKGEITYFAMLHDDVLPGRFWLDTLVEELEANDADIVSCVIPIKDVRGITSTALETSDIWNPKRLTLKEVFSLPETFTSPDLLLNTGCWVCRMDRPWCSKVSFRQQDKISKTEKDGWRADTISEDWDFSRQVRAAGGVKLYATRKVQLDHEQPQYTNKQPWGQWKVDETHLGEPTERGLEGVRGGTPSPPRVKPEELPPGVESDPLNDIPGWFDWPEYYDRVVREAPPGSLLVEVGVYAGKSLAYLARAAKNANKGLKVVGVDHFEGDAGTGRATTEDEVRANLDRHGLGDVARLLPVESGEGVNYFSDGEAYCVFLDASHDTASVRRDISLWLPKVAKGGILAGHDADYETVRAALADKLGREEVGWDFAPESWRVWERRV